MPVAVDPGLAKEAREAVVTLLSEHSAAAPGAPEPVGDRQDETGCAFHATGSADAWSGTKPWERRARSAAP